MTAVTSQDSQATHSTAEAQHFLRAWFGTRIPEDATIEVRVKPAAAARPWQLFFDSVENLSLDKVPASARAWVGTCLRRRGTTTGKAKDVTYAAGVWADLDGVAPADALRRAQSVLPSTFVVGSGSGAHVWWKLRRLLDITKEQQATWLREVVNGLASQLGGDPLHDVSRVLGLPGSLNTKYDPPRQVRIFHADPQQVFDPADFGRFQKPVMVVSVPRDLADHTTDATASPADSLRHISPRLQSLVKAGWSKGCGYKSRSELDAAVAAALVGAGYLDAVIVAVFMDPANGIGDKVREMGHDGARYLARTIATAREYVSQQKAQAALPAIKAEDGVLKALRDNGAYKIIYTGELRPIARISAGAESVWEVEAPGGVSVTLAAKSLASSYGLKCALPPVAAWTGTDADTQNLIPYFETFNAPDRQAVKVVGWHGDRVVFPGVILGPEGLEADSALVYRGELPAALTVLPNWASLAGELPRLLDLHTRAAMYGMLGWFLATFLAPQIRKIVGGPFPLLNVWGSTGAGKTTTLNILWRLTGSTRSLLSAGGGSTAFTKTANLAATNTVPVIYDEHRAGNGRLARFYETLREAYQASEHERGRADLGVTRLTLTAPVVVSGESALPEPALRQRSLIVRLSPQAITDTTRETKQHVESLSLLDFAGGAYQHVRTKVPRLRELWEEEAARARRVFSGKDDRQLFALITPLVGLRLFEDFVPVPMDEAASALARLSDVEEGSTVHLVDETVRALFRLYCDGKLSSGAYVKVERDTDGARLFVNPSTSLAEIESYLRRERPDLPVARDAIRNALREDAAQEHGLVIEMRHDKKMEGQTRHVIVINLNRVHEQLGIAPEDWRTESW